MVDVMEEFKVSQQIWNEEMFDNIFQKKKICRGRLLGIQKHLAVKWNSYLANLETELIERNGFNLNTGGELVEEKNEGKLDYSRGAKYPQFFHASVVDRRRKRKILQFKNSAGCGQKMRMNSTE